MEITDIKYSIDTTTHTTKIGTYNSKFAESMTVEIEHEGAYFDVELPGSYIDSIKEYALLKGKELVSDFIKRQTTEAQS